MAVASFLSFQPRVRHRAQSYLRPVIRVVFKVVKMFRQRLLKVIRTLADDGVNVSTDRVVISDSVGCPTNILSTEKSEMRVIADKKPETEIQILRGTLK